MILLQIRIFMISKLIRSKPFPFNYQLPNESRRFITVCTKFRFLHLSYYLKEEKSMEKAELRSLIAIPFVLLVASGVALAGSQGWVKVSGIPLFALGVAITALPVLSGWGWLTLISPVIIDPYQWYPHNGEQSG